MFAITSESSVQENHDRRFGQNFQFDMVHIEKESMITESVYILVSDTALYKAFEWINPKTNGK